MEKDRTFESLDFSDKQISLIRDMNILGGKFSNEIANYSMGFRQEDQTSICSDEELIERMKTELLALLDSKSINLNQETGLKSNHNHLNGLPSFLYEVILDAESKVDRLLSTQQ